MKRWDIKKTGKLNNFFYLERNMDIIIIIDVISLSIKITLHMFIYYSYLITNDLVMMKRVVTNFLQCRK